MATTPRSVAVGVFQDQERARDAIGALKDAGFSGDDISLLMPDRGQAREMAEETGTKAGEGAASGLVAGGILGGLGGFLVGIGALAIPGVGPFIAAGALATTLGGAAVGAGIGAIAGALIGMGIPEDEAKYYEGEVRGGRTLLAVRAGGRVDEADSILHDFGAYDVEHRDRVPSDTGATGTPNEPSTFEGSLTRERAALELRQEELHAEKRPVETGQVTVGKDVVEEHRTLEVPVTREEVTIDRQPVDRRRNDRPIDPSSRTIDVPVHEERVEVEKQPVVYEEVSVGKREVTDTQSVSDTVRREEARIEREGDVDVRGWNDAMPTYRQRWQQRYGTTGGRWEDFEPGYRYGYEMRARPEYRGRAFTEVEPNMRSEWERTHPDTPWDRARDAVRETWDEKTG
jgi:uncharacterized protein (TIGR02271 family)